MLTETTLTLNIASTARRTSILLASNATLKVYLFCSCSFTDFSVTIPWRSTSVISTVVSSSPKPLHSRLSPLLYFLRRLTHLRQVLPPLRPYLHFPAQESQCPL